MPTTARLGHVKAAPGRLGEQTLLPPSEPLGQHGARDQDPMKQVRPGMPGGAEKAGSPGPAASAPGRDGSHAEAWAPAATARPQEKAAGAALATGAGSGPYEDLALLEDLAPGLSLGSCVLPPVQ
jgi:hypothetical protein